MDPMPARWYQMADDASLSFALARGQLIDGDDTVAFLSGVLQRGLLNPDFVDRLMAIGGKSRVEAYLATRGFATALNTRVGDFGEVVSGALLEAEESHVQPVHKLRYRETVDWAMRLTDVFTMRLDDEGEIGGLCFTSVKAGLNRPRQVVASEGYQQLVDDSKDAHPEIIEFVSERLYESEDYDTLERFDRMASRPEPVDRLYRLALVFDTASWREDALTYLDGHLDPVLPDFKAYLILAPNLRDSLATCYQRASDRCYNP